MTYILKNKLSVKENFDTYIVGSEKTKGHENYSIVEN